MWFLLIARHLLFIVFFVRTWIRRFALFPLLIWVWLLLYASPKDTQQVRQGVSRNAFISDHLITIARLLIMVWLRWFLDILADSSLMIGIWLLWTNLVLWIVSYVLKYQDGKEVFHYWRYFASILLAISIARLGAFELLFDMFLLRLACTMAVYAFLVFVLAVVIDQPPKSLQYPLFITFNCCILYLIYYYTQQDLGLSLAVAQWYLLLIYSGIWHMVYNQNTNWLVYHDDEDELFRHVLSWQKITRFNKKTTDATIALIDDLRQFLVEVTSWNKVLIWLLNIWLVIGQVTVFILAMQNIPASVDFIWLWAWVILFWASFVLLRSIWFSYKLQRVVAFVVINLALYLTIIAVFGNNIIYIVGLGIIWTVVNALLVMQHRVLDVYNYLTKKDYFYRIIWIGAISLCNIYFMIRLPLSLQLVFSLICFYIGIQAFMIRYALRAIK